MDKPLVEIIGLSKIFLPNGAPALDNINIVIPKGKIVGLVGPDGSGKTTLIRLIAALLSPTTGSVIVDGHDTLSQGEAIRDFTGYMPQKFGLYEELTVMQNLELYADLRGLEKKERKETIERLLKFTNLGHFTDRLAGALSGGMKQKLGLSCALIKTPRLLLLDEPSVGVDPISRRELWKMIQELLNSGISIVWSTAYLDEAERCDSVVLLNGGKALYQGTPKDLTSQVKNRVFRFEGISGSRRAFLFNMLKKKEVMDGVIQGTYVRVLLRDEGTTFPKEGYKMVPAEPRLEDAFINILGGGPGGESRLADSRQREEQGQTVFAESSNLVKKFGDFAAVNKVSFQVSQGEIFGLLGPNGAGKSTVFKMLCGLLHPTSGSAHVNGLDLEKAPGKARAQIGYMAQKFSLYGTLSVRQNLEFFAGAYNLKGEAKKEAIEEMIQIFFLQDYIDTVADDLPLGFKQRLALACANMHSPRILFLDEPTSGVDPITRREFWNHINGLVEKGISVLVSTHFMDEAEYCDRIALVYKGEVIHMGSPDALKEVAQSEVQPHPSLEDAFIKLIEEYDSKK